MIKKLKLKFVATALGAIAVLLVSVFAVVNVVNFALVTADADRVIDMISDGDGAFFGGENGSGESFAPGEPSQGEPSQGEPSQSGSPQGETPPGPTGGDIPGGRGAMGPDAPETQASMRFFVAAVSPDGEVRFVRFNMAAMDEDYAAEKARLLADKKGGWTDVVYRFGSRVVGDEVYVTVVDQGRELLPSFRVLLASVFGTVAGLIVSFIILLFLAGKFVKPIVDSDAGQKKFIADAARSIKTPLTVIALDKERVKEDFGTSEATESIDKQVKALADLTLRLNELIVFDEAKASGERFDAAAALVGECEKYSGKFADKRVKFTFGAEPAELTGDKEMFVKAVDEALDNALAFSEKFAEAKLISSDRRVTLTFVNDAANLPDGDLDTVFERFYKGGETGGNGLGLAMVKSIVAAAGGRARAYGKDGVFTLKAEF